MNCPKCGEEMQLGYIQCRDGVYWSPKIRMFAALPTTKGMIKLDNDDCGAFSGGAAEAYKCEKCRQIFIKY